MTKTNVRAPISGIRCSATFQQGISLIEVMVVVAVTALLALMSASLGGQWVSDARVTQAQGLLQQGYSIAKSTALENPLAQTGTSVAATLCFTGSTLSVVSGSDCSAKAVWSRTLPSSTTVKFEDVEPSCIALTNTAYALETASSRTCTASRVYAISSGTSNVSDKTLY